jgi:hypothetical protein
MLALAAIMMHASHLSPLRAGVVSMQHVCSLGAGLAGMAHSLKKTKKISGLNDGEKLFLPEFHLYYALRNDPYNCNTVQDMLQRITKDKMVDTFIKVSLPTADGPQSMTTQLWCCVAGCDGSRVLLQWQPARRRLPPEACTGPHGAR